MKLSHSVALALSGWLLIGPPQQGGPIDFNVHALLSQWKVIGKYDDLSACERGRTVTQGQWYDKAEAARVGTKEAEHDAAMLMWLFDAICVASDDPRLKVK
jgi:hypothetical protein